MRSRHPRQQDPVKARTPSNRSVRRRCLPGPPRPAPLFLHRSTRALTAPRIATHGHAHRHARSLRAVAEVLLELLLDPGCLRERVRPPTLCPCATCVNPTDHALAVAARSDTVVAYAFEVECHGLGRAWCALMLRAVVPVCGAVVGARAADQQNQRQRRARLRLASRVCLLLVSPQLGAHGVEAAVRGGAPCATLIPPQCASLLSQTRFTCLPDSSTVQPLHVVHIRGPHHDSE
jgi:hypothetical protein